MSYKDEAQTWRDMCHELQSTLRQRNKQLVNLRKAYARVAARQDRLERLVTQDFESKEELINRVRVCLYEDPRP